MSRRHYRGRGRSYGRSRKRPYRSRGRGYNSRYRKRTYNRSRPSRKRIYRRYRKRNYNRYRPSRRHSKRSSGTSPADAAEVVTTLLDMPKEVLAALAAGVLATVGSVALALLKVALWVVIVVGVVLFIVLSVVGSFQIGQWAAHRFSEGDENSI